ncbi:beta-ketoacyl-[acyl-carrier-protein] synthase II [Oceanidesulfovibrio indonesiensis]|uniref:3-oxoacyl-[acyl-carrier-protein] synthase 2 n=1 Tax=Oceanidesulfovibrio indonesiensis TaxID=54767 RepID=A0A7M3MB72_9BACT|nr:beta-ketoacyl-ACP synthase II [Oceanidesulfovibrio indonesiensis]TVM15355.1 beta-ketoacyl-[acyl-carrier-protein] synthase II [Oceanidesulfovibrio indonesiensis]
MRRRVVVTGLSAITPVGNDLETSWRNIVAGVSGIGPITRFDTTEHATKIAGEVKDFDPEPFVHKKLARRLERFTLYAMACAQMVIKDSGLEITEENAPRIGTLLGCGLGGLETIEESHAKLVNEGPKRISPFFIPVLISNMAPGMVSIDLKTRGPNYVTTSACASGLHGIGTAFSEILLGRVDAMVTGGTESTITPLAIAGFNACKALSTRNDDPTKASRPFDKDRDGFVMGEGCGLLLLEELEHAKARGARIYCELVGFGASSDAFHMTAPPEDGAGMALSMENAMRDAGVQLEEVDSINAHATSTPLNDKSETVALKRVFGEHAKNLHITANKSMTGHLLGAAGGAEAVFSAMTLHHGIVPPTINLETPSEDCDLDYTPQKALEQQMNYVLCNSFGFGGTNASLLFKRYAE